MHSGCRIKLPAVLEKMEKAVWKGGQTSYLLYPNACRILPLSVLLLFLFSGFAQLMLSCVSLYFISFCRYHKSQAIYLESKENTKISCVISSVGANEVVGCFVSPGGGESRGSAPAGGGLSRKDQEKISVTVRNDVAVWCLKKLNSRWNWVEGSCLDGVRWEESCWVSKEWSCILQLVVWQEGKTGRTDLLHLTGTALISSISIISRTYRVFINVNGFLNPIGNSEECEEEFCNQIKLLQGEKVQIVEPFSYCLKWDNTVSLGFMGVFWERLRRRSLPWDGSLPRSMCS